MDKNTDLIDSVLNFDCAIAICIEENSKHDGNNELQWFFDYKNSLLQCFWNINKPA